MGKTEITIKDNEGKAIEGATIKVYENGIKRAKDLTTSKDGKVLIENMLKENTYKIDILKQGYVEQKGIALNNIESKDQVLAKEIVLLAEKSNNNDDNTNNNSNNTNNNNSNNNNSNSNTTSNDKTDDGKYEGNLPRTGAKAISPIYFVAVATISAVAFGIRYVMFK
jgi:hypothetical protein